MFIFKFNLKAEKKTARANTSRTIFCTYLELLYLFKNQGFFTLKKYVILFYNEYYKFELFFMKYIFLQNKLDDKLKSYYIADAIFIDLTKFWSCYFSLCFICLRPFTSFLHWYFAIQGR